MPLEPYVGQLRALAVMQGVLEQALLDCADERIAAVWHAEQRTLPLLEQDLHFFEPRTVADLKEAVEAAQAAATQMRLWSVEQPLALLACLYVLERTHLGARVFAAHGGTRPVAHGQ